MSIRRHLAALGLALLAAPVSADWLYLKDGTTQETKGPWKVRGRMLQFTNRSEVLMAIPAEEVDLAVSEKISKRARAYDGTYEIRGSPDDGTRTGPEYVKKDRWGYSQLMVDLSSNGSHSDAPHCVVATTLAVTSDSLLVVQIGTTIETVKLIGVTRVPPAALEARVDGKAICLLQPELAPGRDEQRRYPAYATLADGSDLALELLRAGEAEPSAEKHRLAPEYRAAAKKP